MRKAILTILIFLACFCTLFGVACSNDAPKDKESIEIGYEEINLTLGETKLILPIYDYIDGASLSFSSSNTHVASIDGGGLVKANNVGETVITVTYGKLKDKCKLTVGLNNQVPMLKLPAIKEDSIQIAKNSFVDLGAVISFNGGEYTDAKITYTVTDTSVGSVVDGIFTPIKTGETEILIKAIWQGVETSSMTKTVKVKVISDVEISINDGLDKELVLYSLDDTTLPFSVTCKEDGQEGSVDVQLTKGSEFVAFEGNTVKSKGLAGYGELTVTFTAISGNVYQKIIPVHVKHTLKTYEKPVNNFSALDGDVVGGDSLRKIFGEDIVSATYGEDKGLRVENNKIYDLPTSGTEMTKEEIIIYGATYALKVDLNGYTKIIDQAEDLAMFKDNWVDFRNGPAFKGYYILANNIDANDYVHSYTGEVYIPDGANAVAQMEELGGLRGTFDGNGYTIDGITFGPYGMFTHVKEGTVKNLALTGVRFTSGGSHRTAIAAYVMNSLISNVYLQVNNYGTGNQGNSVAWINVYNSNIENVLIEATTPQTPTTAQKTNGYGSISHMWNEHRTAGWLPTLWRNVYVISPDILMYCERLAYAVDANNKMGAISVPSTINIKYQTGVERYVDHKEMMSANLSYAGMPSEFWTSENGVLTWKGKAESKTDITKLDTVIEEFSAYDGDINLNKAFGVQMNKVVELLSAYQDDRQLELGEDKILGVKPKFIREKGSIKEVDYVVVTLNGLVDGVEKTVKVGLKAYTRIIDEESDMLMFAEQGTKDSEFKLFNGYYILARNLEMKPEHTNSTFMMGNNDYYMNGRSYAKTYSNKALGLSGTFDGNGYTINNMTAQRYGLFGLVNGGTVKNVAFTNVKFRTWVSLQYVIATHLINATIDNVYVHAETMNDRCNNNVGFVWLDSYNSNVSNMLIEVPQDYDEYAKNKNGGTYYETCLKSGFGSISGFNGECYQPNGWNNDYERTIYSNVYVVSPTVLTYKANGEKDTYVVDGENRTEETVTYKLNGVKRYADWASLKDANLTFTAMNSDLWKTVDGALAWKEKADPLLDITEMNYVVDSFSVLDGNLDLAKVFNAKEGQQVVLSSATQNGLDLEVDGDKILDVTPKFIYENGKIADADYVELILKGSVDGVDRKVRVGVKAFTKVITKAEELAIFVTGIERTDTSNNLFVGEQIDGYYVLGKDIDASEYSQPSTAGYITGVNVSTFITYLDGNIGFTGTFDGKGHKIKDLTIGEHGIFGVINGGVVKNFAVENCKRTTEYSQSPVIAGFVINGAVIENVYVKATGVQNGAIVGDIIASTLKSSVFVVDGTTSSAKAVYGSLLRTLSDRTAPSASFSDVYVISPKVLAHYNAGVDYEIDAQNRTDSFNKTNNTSASWANPTQFNLNGVYRYDSLDKAPNVSTSYWNIKEGVLTWGK